MCICKRESKRKTQTGSRQTRDRQTDSMRTCVRAREVIHACVKRRSYGNVRVRGTASQHHPAPNPGPAVSAATAATWGHRLRTEGAAFFAIAAI